MKTLILFFVLCLVVCLYSNIINVPADQPTIQEGIVAAAETDTVLVAEGTYYENIDFIGKAITVASIFIIDGEESYIENTIINGSQATNPDFGSCVMFMSGEDSTSVITGFTLTEGTGCFYQSINANSGGGILCDGSSPKIISNIVTNNNLQYGGGMTILFESSPILLNNVISDNTASINNGGIGIGFNSNPHLEGNTISNNTANNCTGGILIYNSSSPTLVGNVIRGNSSSDTGGGVDIGINCNPTLHDNIICYNTAGTYGGGIFIGSNSSVNLSYTSIFGNSAAVDGGGIELWSSTYTSVIKNCTIYNNEASGLGSQINCWSGDLEVVNSIIGGNSTNGSVYFNTSSPTFEYCDFYNSDGPDFDGPSAPPSLGLITATNANTDPCDEFMNILLDPLFVTIDDFHLTEESPCIDAGDPMSPPDPDGSIVDMGRFYYDSPNGTEDNMVFQAKKYLLKNYPNPFNPETTISYSIPKESNVELSIYNIKGQKIRTLVKDKIDRGNHSIIWKGINDSGNSVSSGVYFYKLSVKGKTHAVKKCLMLK